MLKSVFTIFRILIIATLIAQISTWFIDYPMNVKEGINMTMFILIGIFYIGMGILWDGWIWKLIMIACGAFLIAIQFIAQNDVLTILGIICVIVPLVLARVTKINGEQTPPNSEPSNG